jgi:elongation factor G
MAKDGSPDLKLIRNLGVIAHIDAGKTTTSEHLLYYAGAKHKLGGVDEGTTETDYDPEEQERGITIYSACIPFKWRDCTVNLIDTPGHVDFTAEVERSLRVLDGAIVVFDAQKGVEAQSETVWRQADKYSVPRMVFVNKMDVVGANFANVVLEVRERLEGYPLPIIIPIGSGSPKDSPKPFGGVIDIIEQKALFFNAGDHGRTVRSEPIPTDMLDEVKRYREQLFDVLTQHDDKDRITTAYLEGQDIAPDVLRSLIRQLTVGRVVHPVLCGSGREHVGIQPLLDAVTYYLPCPLDRPPVVGTHPTKRNEEKRKPDSKEPFCGLVFKVIAESTGDLYFVRIYSGTLKTNSRVFNTGKNVKELIGQVFHIKADPKSPKEDVPIAYAGDIVVCKGLKDSVTGDTLCETQHPILLEAISFAEAVVSKSIEPVSSADKQKLLDTMAALCKEDPTFSWRHDTETGQTLMSGMGTLHLEVKQHKMERDYKLKVRVGKPRVSWRETLRNPLTVTEEFAHTISGTTQYAKLTVEFKNEKSTEPIKVTTKLKPGILTPPLQAAAERGLKNALQSGFLGYPVLHVQAQIIDAHMDPQTSTEIAFEVAGSGAVRKALQDNVRLMEPIMQLEVSVPEEFMGNVLADLNARRAELDDVIPRGKWRVIPAKVPLRLMFDYADRVRSLSQGRASSSMEPDSYQPAPDEVLRAMLDPDAN